MAKQQENITAIKAEQLPQYLASLGLNPYQMTAVIYGLFREVRVTKTLTPGQDNAIHIDREKIIEMAKDQALMAKLSSLYSKVSRSKNWEALFEKDAKKNPHSAPGLWHNPNEAQVALPQGVEPEEEIEIVDFVKFMSSVGLDPQLVKKAFEEMALLSGRKN